MTLTLTGTWAEIQEEIRGILNDETAPVPKEAIHEAPESHVPAPEEDPAPVQEALEEDPTPVQETPVSYEEILMYHKKLKSISRDLGDKAKDILHEYAEKASQLTAEQRIVVMDRWKEIMPDA